MTRLLFGVDRHPGMLQSNDGVSPDLDVSHSEEDGDEDEDGEDEVCEEEEFVRRAKNPFRQKYRRLYWMLCELVDDYGLLSYLPLDVNVPKDVMYIVESDQHTQGCGDDGQGKRILAAVLSRRKRTDECVCQE